MADMVMPPPPLEAARCWDDRTARSAALAGSRVCSTIVRSCAVCRWVGEAVFGVAAGGTFRVEYCRLMLMD